MINFEAYLLFWFDLTTQEGDPSTEQWHAVMWEVQRDWMLLVPALILGEWMDAHKAFCSWIHSHMWEFMEWMAAVWQDRVPPLPGTTARCHTGRERGSFCENQRGGK